MKLHSGSTNSEFMEHLGSFLLQERLRQNLTQQEVSDIAGISRRTLSQIEKGEGGTLATLLQVLRAIDRVDVWDVFEKAPMVNPLVLAKMEKNKRERASKRTEFIKGNTEIIRGW